MSHLLVITVYSPKLVSSNPCQGHYDMKKTIDLEKMDIVRMVIYGIPY